jgi:antitoxin ParD1/3/4
MPRKTITFTEKQERFIQARIDIGDYVSDSEYIRDLVRRDQENSLKDAVLEGLQSGISQLNVLDIIKEETAKMLTDGRLSSNT